MTVSEKKTQYLISMETPIGQMVAGAVDEGICSLEFDDKTIYSNSDFEIVPKPNHHLDKLKFELEEYFEGRLKSFTVPLAMQGTEFQKKVWNVLQNITYGTTQTYKQQSENIHQPLAIRAMAHANGQNPIAILIPCHRVIGTNGKLTGYAGGLWRKKWLLEHERVNSPLNGTLF